MTGKNSWWLYVNKLITERGLGPAHCSAVTQDVNSSLSYKDCMSKNMWGPNENYWSKTRGRLIRDTSKTLGSLEISFTSSPCSWHAAILRAYHTDRPDLGCFSAATALRCTPASCWAERFFLIKALMFITVENQYIILCSFSPQPPIPRMSPAAFALMLYRLR